MSIQPFSVRVDTAEMRRLIRDLRSYGPKGSRLMYTAAREAGRSGRTSLKRSIASVLNLPQYKIGNTINLDVGGGRPADGPSVSLITMRKKRPLVQFPHTPKDTRRPGPKKGVSVKMLKNEPRLKLPHSFVGRGSGGEMMIFRRKTEKRRPIEGRYGMTEIGVLEQENNRMLNKQTELIAGTFENRLRSKISLMIERGG